MSTPSNPLQNPDIFAIDWLNSVTNSFQQAVTAMQTARVTIRRLEGEITRLQSENKELRIALNARGVES